MFKPLPPSERRQSTQFLIDKAALVAAMADDGIRAPAPDGSAHAPAPSSRKGFIVRMVGALFGL